MRHAFTARSRFSFAAVVALAVLALVPARAVGQQAVLRGVVTDSVTGSPVGNADVFILSLHRLTRTDDKGAFTFPMMAVGPVEITVRRLGYVPQNLKVVVTDKVTLQYDVSLVAQPDVLEAVKISEAERRRHQNVEEFYERRARGLGTYVTREEIEKARASAPSDVLRQTPGIRFVKAGMGKGIRFNAITSMRRGDCAPTIWIDGQRAAGMEIDDIQLQDIEGIELYNGNSTTPAQFWRGSNAQCGTIVVWSRLPGKP